MANKPKDTSKPDTQPENKKSETVHLTADDLRAISGGSAIGPGAAIPGPAPSPSPVKKPTTT
jgi:hypothetical protein